MEQRMPERRRFTQTTSLEERLAKEATQLRKRAQGTPPGVERDLLGSQSPPSRDSFSYDRVAGRATSPTISSIRNGYLSPIKELYLGAGRD